MYDPVPPDGVEPVNVDAAEFVQIVSGDPTVLLVIGGITVIVSAVDVSVHPPDVTSLL